MSGVSVREGDERLSDVTGSDPRRNSGSGDDKDAAKAKPAAEGVAARSKHSPKSSSKSPSDVGKALRSVYDATLGERVPDDFLDLLGKLS